MFRFDGKSVFLCGGAGYLGFPVSMQFASRGACVVIADYNAESAERAVSEIRRKVPGSSVSWLAADVSDEGSVKAAAAEAVSRAGGIEVMVNLAAAGSGMHLDEITPAEFDRILHANITGSFMLAREFAGRMTNGGSIILYSSMYGRVAPDPGIYEPPMKPNPVDYGAAKAGIEQLVRYLAVSWARRNIRVNGICPGPFPNAGKPSYKQDEGFTRFAERLARKVPMGRVGRREETAGAALFLASEESSFITGHTIVIDGGWTCW